SGPRTARSCRCRCDRCAARRARGRGGAGPGTAASPAYSTAVGQPAGTAVLAAGRLQIRGAGATSGRGAPARYHRSARAAPRPGRSPVIQRFCFVKLADDEVATRAELAELLRARLISAGADAVVGLPADASAARWDLSIVITAASLEAWNAL